MDSKTTNNNNNTDTNTQLNTRGQRRHGDGESVGAQDDRAAEKDGPARYGGGRGAAVQAGEREDFDARLHAPHAHGNFWAQVLPRRTR